jgi:hypothetical protein
MEEFDPQDETSSIAPQLEDSEFRIEKWQIDLIRTNDNHGPRQPYQHAYAFVKNKQAMSRSDFEETLAVIHDILDNQGVNFGILMFMHGSYVFTEVPVDLNPLIIKLANGINFNGEVTSSFGNLTMVNETLRR